MRISQEDSQQLQTASAAYAGSYAHARRQIRQGSTVRTRTHTQTARSSSAGLYCQAMPPGIRHKAHCKAHGKAFFRK